MTGNTRRAATDAARLSPRDTIMVIDESHQSIPQVRGMFEAISRANGRWLSTDSVCRQH